MSRAPALTAREEYLVFLIATWQEDFNESPTRADIAEAMGVSAGRATQLVASLEQKGVLERVAHRSRGIRFTYEGWRYAFPDK